MHWVMTEINIILTLLYKILQAVFVTRFFYKPLQENFVRLELDDNLFLIWF